MKINSLNMIYSQPKIQDKTVKNNFSPNYQYNLKADEVSFGFKIKGIKVPAEDLKTMIEFREFESARNFENSIKDELPTEFWKSSTGIKLADENYKARNKNTRL